MYYVIPERSANADLARKFIELATSPQVQAVGIVQRFTGCPASTRSTSRRILTARSEWLLRDIPPEQLQAMGRPMPQPITSGDPGGLRAASDELRPLLSPQRAEGGERFSEKGRRGFQNPPSSTLRAGRVGGAGPSMSPSRTLSLLLILPASRCCWGCSSIRSGFSVQTAFSDPTGALTLEYFRTPSRPTADRLFTPAIIGPSVATFQKRSTGSRRHAFGENKLAVRILAALPLAAVHPVHRRGAVHAHFPRAQRR
jgi:hypothetical protein